MPETPIIRVLHLIDETAHEGTWATLRRLIGHGVLPGCEHGIALLGRADEPAGGSAVASIRFPARFGWLPAIAPRVRGTLRRRHIHLVHAWGPLATAIAHLAVDDSPFIATVTSPPVRRSWSRWWWFGSGSAEPLASAIVCPSQTYLRRAIEAGMPADRCGVIQPAVDFAAINEARRSSRREMLGLAASGPVLLTAPPPSRAGGHYHAVWAAAILQHVWPDTRIVVPGVSAEARRLRRFVASFGQPALLVATGNRFPFERLLAIADVMVVAAHEDVPAEPIAWAMAAGTPIVATAVPAVTEYLADHRNALLCRPGKATVLAARIRALLRDPALSRRLADTGRGDAFGAFGAERLIRQYRALYANVMARRTPFADIGDPAVVA